VSAAPEGRAHAHAATARTHAADTIRIFTHARVRAAFQVAFSNVAVTCTNQAGMACARRRRSAPVMEALDLSLAPPRAPRAELAGVVFLPRTIDKVRATLPGGALGAYNVEGFSTMMLDALEIPSDAFVAAVRDAADDADVAAFVATQTTAERIDAWNTLIRERLPRAGDRAAAIAAYPWLQEYTELPKALDVLAEDDRRHFAAAAGSAAP
jgi:Domain of unknown function (DUF5069)